MKSGSIFVLILLLSTFSQAQQLLLEENFEYPAGTNLTLYGWTAHSGQGSNSIQAVTPGLVYTGYPGTGVGNSAYLNGTGEDVSKNFSQQTSGVIYSAFMLNVNSSTTTGVYFYHLAPTNIASNVFVGKMFVRSSGTNINFGISKRSNTAVFSADLFNLNTTYLLIIKYVIQPGSADDEVNLFVFTDPNLPLIEPSTPLISTVTDTIADPANIGSVALRQGSGGPTLNIDGIRIGTSWESVTSGTVVNPPVIANLLAEPFPAGQNIAITCDVAIASGSIDSVYLYYYSDFNQINTDSVPMNSSGGNVYEYTLSPLSNGTSLIYWVKAWGNTIFSLSETKKVIIGIPDIGTFHTQLDPDGLPLHLAHLARLRGIVTVSTGVFSTTNYDFYMQDNTGGINVFDFGLSGGSPQYPEGDSLEVVGRIDAYNGKVEITNFDALVLSSGNPLPDPININIEDMGEEYEGRLIAIDNASLVAGNIWFVTPIDTSFNVTINDGTGDLTLRVLGTTDIGGNPEPSWPITVVGIGNQYDFSAPYFEFYQILPRSYGDLMTVGVKDRPLVVYQYRLEQNYPNPFNPRTLIRYQLQEPGTVEFRIFNILGQQVFRQETVQPAGTHAYVFDGSHLSSGIYFYQLESGDFKAVRKMILAR